MLDLPLTFLQRPAIATTPHPWLLVLMHGVGSNEQDLFSLAPQIPDRFHVLSLRAPTASVTCVTICASRSPPVRLKTAWALKSWHLRGRAARSHRQRNIADFDPARWRGKPTFAPGAPRFDQLLKGRGVSPQDFQFRALGRR